MIKVLGSSPISSVTTAGKKAFLSVFQHTSKAFSNDSNRYPRSYTTVRGVLINKDYLSEQTIDLNKGYQFQFNPQTISDVKNTLYEVRPYAGLPYNDYIWGGGGERIISFQLFLDNTPQSKQSSFRPDSYNSKTAKGIKPEKGYTFSPSEKSYFGKGFVDEIDSQMRSMRERIVPTKGPSKFEYTETGAFSTTRVSQRGILDEVEKIQSFLYPDVRGEEVPHFTEGGVVNSTQFRPPSVAVLAIGPLYLEGVIKSAPVTYTLFDKDLTPIRGTIDIEFAVFEFANVDRKITYTYD